MLYINCTDNYTCEITGSGAHTQIYQYCIISFSLLGLITNTLSLFIFTFSNNMNTRFLRYLKWYVVNSLVVTFNCFLLGVVPLSLKGINYNNNFNSNYSIMFFYVFICIPTFLVSYTFGSLLDIIIAYERILMYLPKVKFMRNIKIHLFLFVFFVLSCLINTPTIFSFDVASLSLNFDRTVKVYYFNRRSFNYNDLYTVCLYVSTFLRDILTFVIELVITTFLVITIVKFYNKKRMVLNTEDANSDPIVFHKTDMNNSKLTLFICFFSSINHILIFVSLTIFYYCSRTVFIVFLCFCLLINLIKHSLNFLILLKLNKKFKRNFVSLLPNAVKSKKKSKSNQKNSSVNIQVIFLPNTQFAKIDDVPRMQSIGGRNEIAFLWNGKKKTKTDIFYT